MFLKVNLSLAHDYTPQTFVYTPQFQIPRNNPAHIRVSINYLIAINKLSNLVPFDIDTHWSFNEIIRLLNYY